MIALLEKEMFEAAEELEFERAATIRDQIKQLKDQPEIVAIGADDPPNPSGKSGSANRRRKSKA